MTLDEQGGGADLTEQYPGIGQMVADNIVREIVLLVQKYDLLRLNRKLREALIGMALLARKSDATPEEAQKIYEKEIVPEIENAKKGGEIVVLGEKGGRKSSKIPPPKNFKLLLDETITKIDAERDPEDDAIEAAIDEIMAGKMTLDDIFLPYREKVRGKLQDVLCDNFTIIDGDLLLSTGQRGEIIEEQANPAAIQKHRDDREEVIEMEELLEILKHTNEEILQAVREEKLSQEIGRIILGIRSGILHGQGVSNLGAVNRIMEIIRGDISPLSPEATKAAVHVSAYVQWLARMAREEKIARMRTGESLSDDTALDTAVDSKRHPATAARLRLIEGRAIEHAKEDRSPAQLPTRPSPRRGGSALTILDGGKSGGPGAPKRKAKAR